MNRGWPATEGVRRVVAFNWPKLVFGAAFAAAAAAVAVTATSTPTQALAALAAGGTAYFLVASLAASWWVYDRSQLHDWRWLAPLVPEPEGRWALVHAGFDEAGPSLPAALGPPAAVVDLTPWLHRTSPSNARAQRRHPAPPSTLMSAAGRGALPLPAASFDVLLLAFSAHEVRDRQQREALFEDLRRVLRPAGRVILVEHLRDVPNLAAFGPGALHFQSRREWLRLARRSGLSTVHEVTMTSFVRGFALCPS
jgi:SAM-dependent methyltransferase